MKRMYRHSGNKKEYELLGIGTFGSTEDTLASIGEGIYSENINIRLAIYKSGDTFLLHHAEGPEEMDTSIDYAIYQAQYNSDLGDRVIWVRPREMFFGQREIDGQTVNRFERI